MDATVSWLLDGADPSLEYQVRRDLLRERGAALENLRRQTLLRGWAHALLERRAADGHWGRGAYSPKWTCTHYVLYELVQLGVPADYPGCAQSSELLLSYPLGGDGGINYARTVGLSDVCVNGMLLTFSSYFGASEATTRPVVDYLLKVPLADGGWNCVYHRGARHSSLHTTISVLESFFTYLACGREYRRQEISGAIGPAVEFILKHKLFRSERTGEEITDQFFKFCFPVRWKYDILRCLDLFQKYGIPYDPRMNEALGRIDRAGGSSRRWRAASQAGETYFVMEKNGTPSKWNTLRAMRVLSAYGKGEAVASREHG